MTFFSIEFYIFLVMVMALVALWRKQQKLVLLIASYVFYTSMRPEYTLLLVVSTLTDFFVSNRIEQTSDEKKRKGLLGISLFVNITLLVLFKYFIIIPEFINFSLREEGLVNVLIPIGISFYTFQTMGYTIDVYRGNIKAERDWVTFALFVSFFPQLVAGPIERAKNLLPQIQQLGGNLTFGNISAGARLIIFGLFQKLVVSSFLGSIVVNIINSSELYPGYINIAGVVFFAIWVYIDFKAYTEIALGVARMFGVQLSRNFNRPFFAGSYSEIWKRWHITLYDWLKHYLYFPLGGSRRGRANTYFNVLIVFAVSGLWHGAGLNLVLFGVVHGILVVIELLMRRIYKPDNRMAKIWWIPKLFLWMLVVVLFAGSDLSQVGNILSHFFSEVNTFTPGWTMAQLIIALGGVFFILFLDAFNKNELINPIDNFKSLALRWALYQGMIFTIISTDSFGVSDFVYAQF